jgi:hypothetical protein
MSSEESAEQFGGSMAVVSGPGGATIGIWQPGLHQGFGILSETGARS